MSDVSRAATRLLVTGRVQGVGYREWTRREASARGLAGWVRNRGDGSVEALVAGEPQAVDALVAAMARGPFFARVTAVRRVEEPAFDPPDPFEVRATAP